ncbi:LacI family DNA-binding transcriptional regulator [Microbacterium fluvii]|uniref:LacI family DNA-binding transcriptional regulator n=1 Tax=Microbacterium fluvii TaxID=415215 RepID=A0ABW2HJH4_9MICO|nr:LacI family DNA-binding transcriptional regulator [Microbacterium fluvii]MCU4673312.1 LacI family transcriptional regulator [Microbacterium fluvii]
MTDAAATTRRVGVRDVARLAGVSTQTVSRVINAHPNIRDETRARVLDAMEALDYRVNNAARSLGTATTRTLGVIASDATLFGPAAAIAALETAARAQARWIATAYADAADEASVDDAVAHVLGQGVDGVILVAPHVRAFERLEAMRLGVPLIAMHGGAGAEPQSAGAALAVAHLAGLGHRRIARLGGPADWAEEVARAEGFAAAARTHDIVVTAQWSGDWSAAAGAARAPEIAAAIPEGDGPTAIAVANDQMALGLIAGLRDAGLEVPRDVSVTGFDDVPDAAYYRPALTTVRLDLAGEARRCVAAALGEAAGAPPAPPELVVRGSTAAQGWHP